MNHQRTELLSLSYQDHYLSADQLEYFYQTLSVWRQRLQAEYAEARLRIRTQSERVGDIIDQSIEDSTRTLEIINRNRKHHLLTQVDAAMQRILDGSYGYCQITEEEIGFDRLRAYPIATLSIDTQELIERRHRWKL